MEICTAYLDCKQTFTNFSYFDIFFLNHYPKLVGTPCSCPFVCVLIQFNCLLYRKLEEKVNKEAGEAEDEEEADGESVGGLGRQIRKLSNRAALDFDPNSIMDSGCRDTKSNLLVNTL